MAMTQQEVIKNFVYSLVTTKKLGTYAVDEAVRYATKFDGLSDSRTQFLNDIQRVNDSNTFLKDYAGIILDNADTGAITGSDAANGLVKTGKSVIKEKNPVSTWQLPTAGTTITLNDGITNLVYPSTGADGQNFTDAEKFIMRGLKEWVEAGLSANKEAYNLALIGTSCNKIIFQFARGDIGNAQTLTTKLDSKGYPTEITIKINMDKFSYITLEDEDGFTKKPGYVVTYLSRTLAHELNHLLIKANITQAQWNNLPAYVAEGLADLLHGIDDYRTSIPTMGGNADYMEKLLADSRTNKYIEFSNVTDPDYSGGYIFLRYLAKQSATTYIKNFVGTEDAEHYQTSNDFVTISSAGGNDTIESDGNKNSLNGGAGDDSIIIGGEENTVESGQDNDEISLTSASKNTLILYRVGNGNDTIYNSKSTDTLSIDGGAAYTETTINGTFFLGVGDASIALTGERPEIIQSNVEGAAITLNNSVSNTLITGSDDADSIVNTGFSVTINGGSGNNTIKNGSYENGAVFNGGNSVSISAGDGDNYIYGKEDQFVTVVAGNGNDSAHSYMGEKNSINLAGGNNYFNGYYAKGISVSCGAQDDTLCALGGENLYYSAGDGNNYVLLKDVTNSTFLCGVGNDTVKISGSANSVDVGTGNNFVSLGSSSKNDTVMCAAGNSTIKNIDGSQNVYYCDFDGDTANISLVGANSGDTIFIAGYTAFETLNNGTELVVKSGNGILRAINAVDKNITVRNCGDPPANDTITPETLPSSRNFITLTNSDKSKVTLKSPIKDADASSRTKSIKIKGNGLDNSIVGGAGNDSFVGSSGNDTMTGGYGKDTLRGGTGNDYLEGGKDKDRLYGEDGSDFLSGGNSADYLSGGYGNDTLDGGTNNDTINGGAGDDSLVGGSGKDSMKGGAGNDTLDGGIGNDKYWGGYGDDLFIYTADGSKDTIFDYEDGDMLQILGGSFSKSKYKKGTLTLTVGKGSLTFKNITTSTEFNINGDDYYIRNKKLAN